MSIFTGSGVALSTPFTKSNEFDASAYERLIEFQIKEGTAALVPCGTTGESATLTADEHIEVVKTAVAAAKKYGAKYSRKVPVIAGAGGNNTANCIAMGKALQATGADAIMCVTPYYNKTSQKGLLAHYTEIATQVDLPIMVYNVPVRTSLNMLPTTLQELGKLPNIVAVKEASSDIDQIAETIERCGADMDIYVGNDSQILPVLALGGRGVVSTMGNIAPGIIQGIVDLFFAGKLDEARVQQLSILPMIRLLFSDVNPMPVKAALNIMDFDMGLCRLPLVDVSDTLKADLTAEMKRIGIL